MVQTMASGVGGFLAAQPMRMIQRGVGFATGTVSKGARSMVGGMVRHIRADNPDPHNSKKER